jgi:hypothetical protein
MSRTSEAPAGIRIEETATETAEGPYKQPLEEYDLFMPPGTPFPNWLAGTLVPVVRPSTKGERYHAPDFHADEVATACWNDETDGVTLFVRELRHVQGWYEPCRCAPCREAFGRMGLDVYDDLELTLPNWAEQFETPVVTTATDGQNTAHAPADRNDPYPACAHHGGQETQWVSVKGEENEELTPCQTGCCQEKFAWMDAKYAGGDV